jgi:high-affinity Fe2+/Pb2+ permease
VLFYFYIAAGAVCLPCLIYLLQTPAEKEDFFLTRWLGNKLFPALHRNQRQQRLQYIAGFLFALFAIAALVTFFVSRFGRG